MEFPTIDRLLKKEQKEKTVRHICEENPDCDKAEHCTVAIEATTFEDAANNIIRYIKGFGDCEL